MSENSGNFGNSKPVNEGYRPPYTNGYRPPRNEQAGFQPPRNESKPSGTPPKKP